jgi:hypothetical protein
MGTAGRRWLGLAGLLIASVLAAPPAAAAALSCEALMREIKLGVFDEKWEQVQTATGQILGDHPDCRHRQQAAYLRAQALDRLGRSDAALAAYRGFLADYCAAGASGIDCSQGRVSLYNLAGRLYTARKRPEHLQVLLDGLQQPGDAGTFAALTLADVPDAGLRAKALPRLLAAYKQDVDADVGNRICLAILKIDPARSPCSQGRSGSGQAGPPTLISVEMFNKQEQRVELKVNMPVALADAVIKALPAEVHLEMTKNGIDIQAIYQAVRDQARGTLFQAETDEMTIRIWLQ